MHVSWQKTRLRPGGEPMETATKLTSKPTRSTSFREAEDLTREPASKYRNIHLVGGGGLARLVRVELRFVHSQLIATTRLDWNTGWTRGKITIPIEGADRRYYNVVVAPVGKSRLVECMDTSVRDAVSGCMEEKRLLSNLLHPMIPVKGYRRLTPLFCQSS